MAKRPGLFPRHKLKRQVFIKVKPHMQSFTSLQPGAALLECRNQSSVISP
jgi:hypothetical protein